jgi:hypothetical protein
MNYINEKGECGCKKPIWDMGDGRHWMDYYSIDVIDELKKDVIAQSRFHAKAMREADKLNKKALEPTTDFDVKSVRSFMSLNSQKLRDAVLKCMQQNPSDSLHDPKHKVSDMEGEKI